MKCKGLPASQGKQQSSDIRRDMSTTYPIPMGFYPNNILSKSTDTKTQKGPVTGDTDE